VRSILVCVKTPSSAQAVSTASTRLGLAGLIATVVGGPQALARVAEAPPDVLLVDTGAARPDPAAFTREVLKRSPEAVVIFLGPEEPVLAQGAVDAGARGLIRGGDREDLVATVAKALMLLLRPSSSTQAVPLQRSEIEGAEPDATDDADAPAGTHELAGTAPSQATGPSATGASAGVAAVGIGDTRGISLTERELQVLRGMAEGRSNAEIGRELYVSEDTVKTHARRLFRKLCARDRAHAVAAAFRAGLVH
jgi:DNA-binding NarL/FixJ family response regulator